MHVQMIAISWSGKSLNHRVEVMIQPVTEVRPGIRFYFQRSWFWDVMCMQGIPSSHVSQKCNVDAAGLSAQSATYWSLPIVIISGSWFSATHWSGVPWLPQHVVSSVGHTKGPVYRRRHFFRMELIWESEVLCNVPWNKWMRMTQCL